MSLWVDKHRPTSLGKLDFHKDQAIHLKKLVQGGDFPHLLVYGPSGAGKKTRIMCLLRELYGSGVEKLRIEHETFTTPSNKKVEISTISSNYHIEVNPSDVGNSDRIVIQEMIKNVAQVNQLDSSSQKDFKVIILTEVDRLSKDAQHALRRTMEKYMATCRLILCCNSTSKVIPAIRSRCLGIRVPAPSIEEICQILQTVCKKECVNLPSELAQRIAEKSNRNLRRALLMCEACKVQQMPLSPDQEVSEPDWELYLKETASMIVEQQSPKSDVGNSDRIVIQEMIKNVAQVNQLDSSSQKDFKVIILTEVDRLSKDAQHALRRTMEKYMATCRLILCCNSTSKVIPAIRSRCLGIRVPAPSIEEICQILQTVCKKECVNLPSELAQRIAEKSNRNLRRALLMCEACKVQQMPLSPDQEVSEPDWELYLKETASMIVEQQSPKRLLEIRGRLYELLTHCIPPDIIMKGLLHELLSNCDGQLKLELVQQAAYYEHRLQLGQKSIYHLEAFVAKFMACYKRFLEEGIADLF